MFKFQHNGLLTPGIHRMPLEVVEKVFVHDCDHRYNRQRIFDALRLLIELLPTGFGRSQVFVSGPFVTKETRAPKCAHVAIVPQSDIQTKRMPPEHAVKLMSLGSVFVGRPELMSFTHVDPMGGLLRSMFAYEDNEVTLVKGMLRTAVDQQGNPIRDIEQGYLEIEP